MRVYTGDGKGEVRIVFVGKAKPHRFHAATELTGVAIERLLRWRSPKLPELLATEDRLVNRVRADPLADELHGTSHWHSDDDLHRFREEGAVDGDVLGIRTAAAGASWSLALEAERSMFEMVGGLPEFRDASTELDDLVLKTGEELAARARMSADAKVLAEAESAVALHAKVAGNGGARRSSSGTNSTVSARPPGLSAWWTRRRNATQVSTPK